MVDSTQPAQQARPTTPTSVARPNKKCWTAHNWAETQHWAQCYSLNNWISHWCKVSGFHWTTLMQDTVHWLLQAWATNTILYDCIPVILVLCSKRIQHRSTTVVWLREVQGCKPPPWKVNAKLSPHSGYISVFSTFLVFSKLLFFVFFGSFWLLLSGDFGFQYMEIHIPINFHF